MTDTAVPMPEPAQRNPGDVETDPGALTAEQQQRVRALGFARDTLVTRGLFSGTDVSKWTTGDLLAVADWILQGSETPGVLLGTVDVKVSGQPEYNTPDGQPCVGEELNCQDFTDLPPTGESDPEPISPEPDDGPSLTGPAGWWKDLPNEGTDESSQSEVAEEVDEPTSEPEDIDYRH